MKAGFFAAIWRFLATVAGMNLGLCLMVQGEPESWAQVSAVALALFTAMTYASRFVWLGRSAVFVSEVTGSTGNCVPTWLNTNQVCLALEGLTGFFRPAWKVPLLPVFIGIGGEFHGRIEDGRVFSTEREHVARPFNVEGTRTGRFHSADKLEANHPKGAW